MRREKEVIEGLLKQGRTLAIAESCTGGLLSACLTDIPGSSQVLKLGIVAYSNEAKTKLLKISTDALKRHGAVSEAVSEAMAQGARKLLKTDFGLGITGIAGPSGTTKTKPVGLTFLSISTKDETLSVKCIFEGDRKSIRRQATEMALKLLLEFLA